MLLLKDLEGLSVADTRRTLAAHNTTIEAVTKASVKKVVTKKTMKKTIVDIVDTDGNGHVEQDELLEAVQSGKIVIK